MTARDIIHKEYGSAPNFMTPHRLGYGRLPYGAYELSTGTDFNHQPIWGVSVVQLNADGTTKRLHKLSEYFHSREAANRYITNLRRMPVVEE